MQERIPVAVRARDPISQAGIASQLRNGPDTWVVDGGRERPTVTVIVADEVDEKTVQEIRAVRRNGDGRVVLVVSNPDDGGLFAAVEAGASGLLRRSDAVPEKLSLAVRGAAAGDGTLPPDLLGRLLRQMGQLQRDVLTPRGISFSGLTERETEVLRLVADGHNTTEIATRLSYSERTIKNIIQDVITRFQLRNRSHAVAFALRQGLI